MEEKVQLRTYTVADLKDWLIHNRPKEGLSASVVAPTRAYAIVHNPYVENDMKVVCAVFVNDKIVAFTAAFPEILQKPKGRFAWWFTTLWCDPLFEGRGYGLIVIGTLAEEYGIQNCFDAEGAPETVAILDRIGLETEYFSKYIFEEKQIKSNSIRGKLALCVETIHQWWRMPRLHHIMRNLSKRSFTVSYSSFVDDDTYSFMYRYSQETVLRSQESLNWILRYPFMQESPIVYRVSRDNSFSSTVESYQSFLLKVYEQSNLIAVSMAVLSRNCFMSVKLMYYDAKSKVLLFDALIEHALRYNVRFLSTVDNTFADYIKSKHLFTKNRVQSYSFSFPAEDLFRGAVLQGAVGDMFV